ncbi:MAG: hypothetical protein WD407_02095 [Rhodospirillales bacterium]
MSAKRLFIIPLAVLAVGTGAYFIGDRSGNAQEASHSDHTQHVANPVTAVPTMPGQEVFGAIQEIVKILDADPATDWSKVDIAALHRHLIDMDEVTMRAKAAARPLPNGAEFTVTGTGRTVAAIKRMVPAHARELAALGWQAETVELSDGVKLTVTAADPGQAVKIKALGFMGVMVQGAHHQPHHLMMAKGGFKH